MKQHGSLSYNEGKKPSFFLKKPLDKTVEICYNNLVKRKWPTFKEETTMARINLSNGSNSYWFTAGEADVALSYAACNGISFEAIASMMDVATSELTAFDVGPCSDDEFLAAYLKRAEEDLIIG